MNVKELRIKIINRLKTAEINEASAISAVLLMHGLNITKTELLMGDYVPSEKQVKALEEWTKRAESGEPVQYIVGETEFMSLKFSVQSGVLIPRADTEILVSAVLEKINEIKMTDIWDLCCGSGCVGISLAHYNPDLHITFADISDLALNTTKENIKKYHLEHRTEVKKFDVLNESIPYEVDGVVSNPPYIAHKIIDSLDRNVKCFEPHLALDGGYDGLDFYRKITETANIKKGGFLAFEIGFDQRESVAEILDKNGYSDINIINDLENRPRAVIGIR